ncbi:MAG TPA: hypothetical protein VJ696_03480, partial [Rhodanobacteraceae bacterium]|nr:hypothetical protein [Rhodanobacteraceae bacterium]
MSRMIRMGWLVGLLLGSASALAASARPTPESWSGAWKAPDRIESRHYDALDLAAVAAEDAAREVAGGPHRFAVPHDTALDIRDVGTWEESGATSIWRYRITADKAASLNVGFTRFHVPPTARLYLYDTAHKQVAGPYDAAHNEPHAQLWTPIIASSDVVIELDVATAERNQVELVIGRIGQGYRGFGTASKGYHQPDLGQPKEAAGKTCSPNEVLSGRCNMDVACLDENDPWNDPRRAVGAIQLGGSDDCTGSLVNNTAGDRRMLFITASHCGLTQGSSPSVVAYWNYEWPTCRTPGSTESGQSNPPDPNIASSGASFLAATGNPFGACSGPTCSDNTLVEFDEAPDPEWNLFWEGWDRRTIGATCAAPGDPASTAGLCASIHHPNVDEKRITFVERNLEVGGISGGTGTHWHAYWDPTPPILPNIVDPPDPLPPGVTEPGSSGSPLFTADKRLVGVLSGGPSACGATGENLSDFYGQLALAWEGTGTPTTRLKDYLDPLGTAPDFIDGVGMSPFTLALDPPSVAVCASAGSVDIDVAVAADDGFSG